MKEKISALQESLEDKFSRLDSSFATRENLLAKKGEEIEIQIGKFSQDYDNQLAIAKEESSNYLKEELGAIHCDIDKIGHNSHNDLDVKNNLINTFGTYILTNNNIDRKNGFFSRFFCLVKQVIHYNTILDCSRISIID